MADEHLHHGDNYEDQPDIVEPDVPEIVSFSSDSGPPLLPEIPQGPDQPFAVTNEHGVPYGEGQPVGYRWRAHHDLQPRGVTWHWTAGWKLAHADAALGGPWKEGMKNRRKASSHYGIGRTFAEGVSRYVSLEDRSWHAGAGQKVRWDGAIYDGSQRDDKGARTCLGVEVVNRGHDYTGDDGVKVAGVGGHRLNVQPWTEEQLVMCIHVGKEIVGRWNHLRPEDHHGHHDLCPGRKEDVGSFPFARVLRGIYNDESIRDVWSPLWSAAGRQRALIALGYDLGKWGADGSWGGQSRKALLTFQEDHGLVAHGYWSTFVCRAVDDALLEKGLDLDDVTAEPA